MTSATRSSWCAFPTPKLSRTARILRSLTSGTGSFTLALNGYQQAPYDVTQQLVEEYQQARAAGR